MTAIRADKKRGRKKPSARPAGPSRIHNKRQQKLVKMVDGYDSTLTLASMLRNTMIAWVVYSIALIFSGGTTLGASEASIGDRDALRLADAIRSGSGMLFLLTVILTATWLARSRMNVQHLGKSPKIGVWNRVKTHAAAAILGAVTLAMVFLSPDNARLFVALTAGLWVFASLWFQFLMMDTVRMLWRTSSPAAHEEEDVPQYAFVWIVSWILYSSTIGLGEGVELTSAQLAPISVFAGLTCLVAAVTMGRLVTAVSARQDARLDEIVSDVDDPDRPNAPVTTSQIAQAWSESEALIDLPGKRS